MVPFDVMTGRNCMVCNSRGVADLCKSFEMLRLPVMQSSFCFNTSSKSFTLKAQKRQDKNDIFLRNSGGRFSRAVLLSVQNIIHLICSNFS